MMTTDEVLARGRSAARILSDADMMQTFLDLERDIKSWSFSKPSTDAAERESVFFQLKGISDVIGRLRAHVTAAEHVLDALNTPEETYDD